MWPVKCETCKTEVGVQDSDKALDFFYPRPLLAGAYKLAGTHLGVRMSARKKKATLNALHMLVGWCFTM